MVIYCTEIFTGALEYKKETFWMLPVSIIKKKYFRGLSNQLSPYHEKISIFKQPHRFIFQNV